MLLSFKLNFWFLKISRLLYYNIRYRLNKWVLIEGVSFPVYLSYGYDVLRFIDNGEYESGEIEIIRHTLERGDKVLELGTGLGFISTYCSLKTGSENVYTFEANPYLEFNIQELYRRNKVKPHLEFAVLGQQNGKSVFHRNTSSLLSSSLKQHAGKGTEAIEVPMKSLNEKIKDISPDYLIMDIEGGEYEIFDIINFQMIRKIQFELHPEILGEVQIAKIFNKLEVNNFFRDTSFTKANNYYFYKK